MSGRILSTRNGEIPLIFELPLGFSVGKAGAGAIYGEELKIISGGEWWNDILVSVEVR